MIKAIIFDLDNTLVDFMNMKKRAVEASAKAMVDAGLPFSLNVVKNTIDEIYNQKGIEYQKVFDLVLEKLTGKIDYRILAPGIVSYRKAREAELVPYPNVYPTLIKIIKNGLKLGIVSDAPKQEAWLRLAYLNLHHLFDDVVTFEETGVKKPDALPFNTILDRLKVTSSEAIMVGDWFERDIIGAQNIGMITAFAKYGDIFNTQNHTADFELNDISDILPIIEKINRII